MTSTPDTLAADGDPHLAAPTRVWNLSPSSAQRFVDHVGVRAQDPGVRAALRSGLGLSPDRARRLHAVLAPWVPEQASPSLERAMYAVTALIAQYGPGRTGVNLGTACAQVADKPGGAGVEHRLLLLTRQSLDGVHRHLPGIVRQLHALDAPLPDWAGTVRDLADWPTRADVIGKRWLQGFYRAQARRDSAPPAGSISALEQQPRPTNHTATDDQE